MPRRFFRKFAVNRRTLAESRLFAPYRHLHDEPRYWSIRRRWVVPAFALGLGVAWLPFPGHPLVATLAALWLRVNLPVAIATTFISNPLTMAPMYYAAYRLGRQLLGAEPREFAFEASLDWVTHQFLTIWQPLTLGCLLLGLASALTGYIVLDLFWRLSLRDYHLKKRLRRLRRKSSSDQT